MYSIKIIILDNIMLRIVVSFLALYISDISYYLHYQGTIQIILFFADPDFNFP